jgi:hypothetical protein
MFLRLHNHRLLWLRPRTSRNHTGSPPISALEEPQEFPDLKFFTSFRCTFLREINSSETASVLLIALPDGSQRILKLFFPQPEDAHDPGTNEYFAYCCLIAQGVCRPPSHSAAKRIVPYCYGGVVLNDPPGADEDALAVEGAGQENAA